MKELLADVVRAIALLIFAVFKSFLSITRWFSRGSQVKSSITRNANTVPTRAKSNGLLAQLWKRILQDQVSANALALWLLVGILSFMFVFKDKLHIWERILDDPWQRAFAAVLLVAIAVMVISAVRNGLVGGVKYSTKWRKRIIWGVPVIIAVAVFTLIDMNKEDELTGAPRKTTSQATYGAEGNSYSSTSSPAYTPRPNNATNEPIQPTVRFISPLGSETLVHNHVFEFRWDAPSISKDTSLDLFLVRADRIQDVYQGLSSVRNSGSYLWLVWDAMEPGPYRLRITRGFDNVLAESEIFNIVR